MKTHTRLYTIMVIALIFLFSSASKIHAQSTFGSVRGATQDQTGAIVPQAQVTLHSLDENTDAMVTSDDQGNYVFQNVKPGHYRLVTTAMGFSQAIVDNIELAARQDLRVDVKLALASQNQTVQVSAAALAVNTENATLTDSKVTSDIMELPLNSRAVSTSPLAALAISPDVVKDSNGNYAVLGATASQTGFSVDGISTASVRQNGPLTDTYPSQEGIAEMKVTAFNNNAEFAQIGDVTFTTKSGTEQLHGSLFEYFQDDVLDANITNFTTKAPNSPWWNHDLLSDEIRIGDSGDFDDDRVVTKKKKGLVDAQALMTDQAAKEAREQTRTVDFSVLVAYQIPTGCGRSSSD